MVRGVVPNYLFFIERRAIYIFSTGVVDISRGPTGLCFTLSGAVALIRQVHCWKTQLVGTYNCY